MSERIVAASTYYRVFAGLIGLTALTVGISFLNVGEWHTLAGLSIAVGKALLVALFFMHLLHSRPLSWIVLGAGLFWLGILMVLTLSDYLTRPWLVY